MSMQLDSSPNDKTIPADIRHSPSSASDRHQFPGGTLPPKEPLLRDRSRSPRTRYPSARLPKDESQLKFFRFIPNNNPNQIFEIRRYTFPADTGIQLKTRNNALVPLPTDEQNVLTTSTGEVFAIVEGNRRLRGMYVLRDHFEKRVKMNMQNGAAQDLTTEEIADTPLGHRNPILKNFRIENVREIFQRQ